MDFQISGLPGELFRSLFNLDEDALVGMGAKRCVADAKPGFPCRVSLADAEIGETLILTPYAHHPGPGPYRASGPVFVRRDAPAARPEPGEIPAALRVRQISVRAYDADHLMINAEVVDGVKLGDGIRRILQDPQVSYLHLHYAGPGCYACRAERV